MPYENLLSQQTLVIVKRLNCFKHLLNYLWMQSFPGVARHDNSYSFSEINTMTTLCTYK